LKTGTMIESEVTGVAVSRRSLETVVRQVIEPGGNS
jgi:hypothetical protein